MFLESAFSHHKVSKLSTCCGLPSCAESRYHTEACKRAINTYGIGNKYLQTLFWTGYLNHCNGFVHHQRVETEPSLSQYHNRLQPPHHVHCPLTAGALQFSQGPIWSGVGCTVTLLPTRAARLIPKMRIPSRVLPYRGSPTQLGWGEKLETVGDATAFLLELEFHHDSANSNIC